MKALQLIYWIFGAAVIWGFVLLCVNAAVDQEYILTISQPETPGFDVVQSGLNKSQAEGAAFQLNEIFKRRGIPVSVGARPQVDIGRFKPKP
jgi:hypothetical protein